MCHADKGSAKDLSAFSDRLAGEAGAAGLAGAEVADAEVAAMEERLRHMPGSAGEDLDPLPFDDAATGEVLRPGLIGRCALSLCCLN